MRYVLGVRSNLVLILVSSLLYFFLAALRTFSSVFVQDQFSVGQAIGTMVLPLVGLGAVIGVLAGGRLSDGLMAAGHIRGRILVGIVGYSLAVVLFLPAFASGVLLIALPLFFLASAALGLLNPPLDAARLDVIHHSMWGRSEGVRTFGMLGATAAAPLTYGFVSESIGNEGAFLVIVGSLALAAILLTAALRSYPSDMAAAEATSHGA
jgi:sugar phosphate permease